MPPFFALPGFEVRALVARFERPLGELTSPPELLAALRVSEPPREIWRGVTALLHRFGRRPSHRLRPGGERIGRAALAGRLRSVDVAVDAATATALRCGLPVTVVDPERLRGPLRVTVTPRATRMPVGADGTTRDVGNVPALADLDGPRVTPVAIDVAARPTAATRTTLSIVWGTQALGLAAALEYHRELLTAAGARCEPFELPGPADDPTARALLARVLADIDDDGARLAFADWLDAHEGACGRRRARYIREGVAGRDDSNLAREVVSDSGLSYWPVGWARGFVRVAHLTRTSNPPLTPRLAGEPLAEVSIDQVELAAPVPATVRRFNVWNPALRRVPHPAPERVRELQLSGHPDADLWRWLASLPNLERLWMHIGDDDPWQLADWPSLRLLHLQGGRFTAASLAALPVRQLAALELQRNGLDDALLRAMPAAPRLAVLRLARNAVTSLEPFAGAPLRELLMWELPLAAAEVRRITAMTDLEALYVAGCPQIEGPLAAALDDGALPSLRRLWGHVYPRRRKIDRGY